MATTKKAVVVSTPSSELKIAKKFLNCVQLSFDKCNLQVSFKLVALLSLLVLLTKNTIDDGVWATSKGFLQNLNYQVGKYFKIQNGVLVFNLDVLGGLSQIAKKRAKKVSS